MVQKLSSAVEGHVELGTSVSFSADGDTLALGANSKFFGLAWVFVRNAAGVWVEQKVFGESAPSNYSGPSIVSLSADGNTLAVGCGYSNGGKGSVSVCTFERDPAGPPHREARSPRLRY